MFNLGDIVKLKCAPIHDAIGIVISIFYEADGLENSIKVYWFNSNPFGILSYNEFALLKVNK